MRRYRTHIIASVLVACCLAMLTAFWAHTRAKQGDKRVHVILIGASIGQGWRLSDWPARTQATDITAESIPAWQFDKSEVVAEVAMRPARKFRPTRTYVKSLFHAPPKKAGVVIIKECSSYFPGDLNNYRQGVQRWVEQLQSTGARVVLATVVPVTRERAAHDSGKQESLIAFNRWIRQFAAEQKIPVLDLEAALADGGSHLYLRDDFANQDGSHLNGAAYDVMDSLLLSTLCRTRGAMACDATSARVLRGTMARQ
jgi:GDSL-like Lipase/Acylhydrolase family